MRDRLKALVTALQSLREDLVRLEAKDEVLRSQRLKLETKMVELKEDNILLLQVVELFKNLGAVKQQELIESLEKFVTYGLEVVFGQGDEFVVILRTDVKDVKAEFYLKSRFGIETSIVDARGGGVAEIVALLIRLFVIFLLREYTEPCLFLDTSMVFLSAKYRENVSRLLKELSRSLNLQVIIIANTAEYAKYADVVYRFEKEGKETHPIREE